MCGVQVGFFLFKFSGERFFGVWSDSSDRWSCCVILLDSSLSRYLFTTCGRISIYFDISIKDWRGLITRVKTEMRWFARSWRKNQACWLIQDLIRMRWWNHLNSTRVCPLFSLLNVLQDHFCLSSWESRLRSSWCVCVQHVRDGCVCILEQQQQQQLYGSTQKQFILFICF